MSRVQLFSKTPGLAQTTQHIVQTAKKLIFVILLGVFGVYQPLHADTLAFYGAYIDIPHDWEALDTPTPNERYFLSQDNSATLNIAYYQAEELTSVNALAQYQVVSRFEGWMSMLDRPAKPEELSRVHANDGRVIVYGRQSISNTNKIKNDIVGEYYYFVSPNVGYVVSIETTPGYWKEQQQTFRNIVDSFGIGQTPAPIQRPLPDPKMPSIWTSDLFRRSSEKNHQKLDIKNPIKRQHRIPLNTPEIGSPHSWALSGNNLYVQFEKYLTCIDTLSKKVGWTFQVPGTALSPIWDYRGILYMVRRTNSDTFLFAIQPDSGGVLFSENLGQNITSAIGSGKTVSMIKSGKLITFDIDTHTTTQSDIEADTLFVTNKTNTSAKGNQFRTADNNIHFRLPPTSIIDTKNTLYAGLASPGESGIEAFSKQQRRSLWHMTLGAYSITQPPILRDDTLTVFVTDTTRHQLLRFDTQTGRLLQRIELPYPVESTRPFDNGIYIQFRDSDQDYSGWFSWDTTDVSTPTPSQQGNGWVTSPQGAWILAMDIDALVLKDVNFIK